tara:strand:+ start:83 stop:1030 length:948 start_codon:yes stop_codon:yes gene_type:complete
MNILITGGTGFFGKSILSYLKKSVYSNGIKKFFINSRNPESIKSFFNLEDFPFEISFFKHDLREKIEFDQSIDYIIHAGAESGTSLGITDPITMRNVVVEGTKNVLDFAKINNIKRILFISSGAIYGKQPSNIKAIKEDYLNSPDILDPKNAYACSKRQAENLCSLYHHHYGIDFVIARCFAFLGPYLPLNQHFAIGNFILDGLSENDILINGDGKTIRSYLFADDLSDWLFKILLNGKSGEAYNVGSNENITIHDLAKLVSKCFNSKPQIKIIGKPSEFVDRYVPNVDKIKNDLMATQNTTLIDGIIKTIRFHQ